MTTVRTRIAPSPTGEDLHIGNVYTALINYVFAKKHGGQFIIRVEDTDRTRLVQGSEQRILASLRWLGLIYDEGPDIGGPHAPYRQSERKKIYRDYALELVHKGQAFYCFCTSERLEQMREQQKKEGKQVLYDGLCKMLPGEEAGKRAKKEPYVIRMNVPEEGLTTFHDVIRGEISFENKLIDDQVILKSDGYPTYHLGVVVDDHLMDITHVIRAEEWISSTPKHVLLYQGLGWKLPVFAHGPILRNPDKSKLSKRKNPVWASWYKEQGYLPEAILNYLALMGWSMPACAESDSACAGRLDGREIFTLEDMMKVFRLEDIRPVGPAFDLKKLEWMNGEYIRQLPIENLTCKITEFIGDTYAQEVVGKTVPLIRERIKKFSDYLPLCEFFFQRPTQYEVDLSGEKKTLAEVRNTLQSVSDWNAVSIGEALAGCATRLEMKNGPFFMTVRVAITGKKISPPLNESIEILGKNEVLERLKPIV